MAKKIFITATNTNIGKTYTTKLLLQEYARDGFKVGVIKPIETGVINNEYLDANELFNLVKKLNSEFQKLTITDIVPISFKLPAAPAIASDFKHIDVKKIKNAILKLEKICDILLIEGAGGLYVPINQDYMMLDLIKELNIDKTLLITHCSLGCINDTLLSKMALDNNNIKNIIAFNCKDEDKNFNQISKPYFTKTDFKVLKVQEDITTISRLLI